jgi:ABC-2 type transport system ATP-binding protein
MIKILATLLLPTSGEAYVKGLEVSKNASKVRKIINLVSGGETPGYGILSVKENLWFFSQLYGLSRQGANERIKSLVSQLGLDSYIDTRMSKLSTGYKQRLNLARGFINNPAVVFLDEPTLGLDVLSAKQLRTMIRSWMTDGTKTVLLTTHYMAEADEMCNRVGIIDQGKILACDTPQRLKAKIASRPSWKIEVTPNIQELDTLKTVPGVIGISEVSNIETGTSTLKLVLEDESVMSDLLSAISKNGSRVLNMGKSEPTLEDVYINLVGKGLQ